MASCLDSKRMFLNTGACPEEQEEEERRGSLGLPVTALELQAAAQRRRRVVRCLDLKRPLLNTGGLPGGEARWVAWSRVAAPEIREVAQRTRAAGHMDSEPLRVTTPEHPGGYLEEEEEQGGSF